MYQLLVANAWIEFLKYLSWYDLVKHYNLYTLPILEPFDTLLWKHHYDRLFSHIQYKGPSYQSQFLLEIEYTLHDCLTMTRGIQIKYNTNLMADDGFIQRFLLFSKKYLELESNDPDRYHYATQINCVFTSIIESVEGHMDLVEKIVKINPKVLRYASEEVMANRTIMSIVVPKLPYLVDTLNESFTLHESLLEDREFVKSLLMNNGYVFEYLPDSLKQDQELIILTIQHDKYKSYNDTGLLRYASDPDREIIKIAIKKNCWNFRYVPERFKGDIEIVKLALQSRPDDFDGSILSWTYDDIRQNLEIVKMAVQIHGCELEGADESFKCDKEIVKLAVQNKSRAIVFASQELQNDKEIVLLAAKQDASFYSPLENGYSTFKKWLYDREIMHSAVRTYGRALQFTSDDLRSDREIVCLAIQNDWTAYEFIHPSLRQDRDLAILAIQINGMAYEYIDKNLRKDRDIALLAVRQCGKALAFMPLLFKNDREIVTLAIQQDIHAYHEAHDDLQQDLDIAKLLIQISDKLNNWVHNGMILPNIHHSFRNNRELVKLIVEQNGLNLRWASEEFKSDREIVCLAVNNTVQALKFAHSNLQRDPTILHLALNQIYISIH